MSRIVSALLPESRPAPGSTRGVERLAGFSDAIVAIAITLILLPLIELASERGASVVALLSEDGYRLGSAGLSFAVIASLWREHHDVLAVAVRGTSRLVSLNLIWR